MTFSPSLIYLHPQANPKEVAAALVELGQWPSPLKNHQGKIEAFQLHPSSLPLMQTDLDQIEGITSILGKQSAHPKVDRQSHTSINLAGFTFNQTASGISNPSKPLLIAGPCSIETEETVHLIAQSVSKAGGQWLRGGAFKPRTSPYSFQGMGNPALKWMQEASQQYGLKMVTEALSEKEVDQVAQFADVIQIGTRNMHNFALLKAVGQTKKPVLLKRGLCATVEEWLLAGEYLLDGGSEGVIFCERGLRSFDDQTRNLLDLGAVALLKHTYGLPVIVDPSHAAGRRDLILPLSKAAMAVGADGLIVETHPLPGQAKSDGPQALSTDELNKLGQTLGLSSSTSIESIPKSQSIPIQNPYELVGEESIALTPSPIPSSL